MYKNILNHIHKLIIHFSLKYNENKPSKSFEESIISLFIKSSRVEAIKKYVLKIFIKEN